MNDRTQHVLDAIDGALADIEFPDAMRWTPEPATVTGAPAPFDGELVWQPPQRYEDLASRARTRWNDVIVDETHLWIAPAETEPPASAEPARILARLLERSIWFEPIRLTPEEHQGVLAEVNRRMADALAAAARAFSVFAEALDGVRVPLVDVVPTARFDDALAFATTESPSARALRLRRERNTGPSRDLTRQRRPRQLS